MPPAFIKRKLIFQDMKFDEYSSVLLLEIQKYFVQCRHIRPFKSHFEIHN